MKTEFAEYMETGTLGAYHPEHAVLRKDAGGVSTVFRDTTYTDCGDHMDGTRLLVIGQKPFIVTSAFPTAPASTPTAKLLQYIDADIKKEV